MLDRPDLNVSSKLPWFFFKLTGRISRVPYILAFLLFSVVMSFPLYQYLRVPEESSEAQLWSKFFMVSAAVFFWVHIATSVKRLHDLGRPGFFVIGLFIPVISLIAFLALCLMPGQAGANQYGQQPDVPA